MRTINPTELTRGWRTSARVPTPFVSLLVFSILNGSAAAEPERHARNFGDLLGVNTHLSYMDSDYAQADWVAADLRYLGLRHVRDVTPYTDRPGLPSYDSLANQGIEFDLLIASRRPVPDTISSLRAFARAHPGAIDAIEGPNEVNNWPVTFEGRSGAEGAIALQRALHDSIRRDDILRKIPVYNLTSWPDLGGAADFANFHAYPRKGEQPYGSLSRGLRTQTAVMPDLPTVLTEVGYYTLPHDRRAWGGVDETAQAKLLLNAIFDSAELGVKRAYLYQLLDAQPDPDDSKIERHFGLFDRANRAKPAAIAMHNLTTALSDGTGSCSPARTKLAYAFDALPATAHAMLLQKNKRAFCLVVWNEPAIWDSEKDQAISVQPIDVSLRLNQSARHVSVFDPLVGPDAPKPTDNTDRVPFRLGDHPIVIELEF